jgi:hypothetical protein
MISAIHAWFDTWQEGIFASPKPFVSYNHIPSAQLCNVRGCEASFTHKKYSPLRVNVYFIE